VSITSAKEAVLAISEFSCYRISWKHECYFELYPVVRYVGTLRQRTHDADSDRLYDPADRILELRLLTETETALMDSDDFILGSNIYEIRMEPCQLTHR
jgi:hypothetical protein